MSYTSLLTSQLIDFYGFVLWKEEVNNRVESGVGRKWRINCHLAAILWAVLAYLVACPGLDLVAIAPQYCIFLKPLFQSPELIYCVSFEFVSNFSHTHHKDFVLPLYSIVFRPLKL